MEAGTVNQAVIAACSPRVNQDNFRFDGVQVIRANLREQVAWTQPPGVDDTEMLAADNIRMAITERTATRRCRIRKGRSASVFLWWAAASPGLPRQSKPHAQGTNVLLVEESGKLGGNALAYSKVMPELRPTGSRSRTRSTG